MNMLPLRAALAASLLATAIGASAKPLVVCTEASPEGFDPVLYTTAVTAGQTVTYTYVVSNTGNLRAGQPNAAQIALACTI